MLLQSLLRFVDSGIISLLNFKLAFQTRQIFVLFFEALFELQDSLVLTFLLAFNQVEHFLKKRLLVVGSFQLKAELFDGIVGILKHLLSVGQLLDVLICKSLVFANFVNE
jgi:hypothetical protein